MDDLINSKQVYTDLNSLNDIRLKSKTDGQAALRESAKQFESIFLQMMLKSMRDAEAVLSEGNPLHSQSTAMYQDMYDKQISMNLSNGNGVGLADMLVKQLGKFVNNVSNQTDDSTAKVNTVKQGAAIQPAPEIEKPEIVKSTEAVDSQIVDKKDKKGSFIDKLMPYARQASKVLGVHPGMLIAQAALETGWGKHINEHKGQSSNNLFNIKAGGSWSGDVTMVNTKEFINQKFVSQNEPFRAYESIEQSFKDYVSFISNKPRYAQALSAADSPKRYIESLQEAGYATDPDYASKIYNIYINDVQTRLEGGNNE